MAYQINKVKSSLVEITITLGADETKKIFASVMSVFKREAEVPGFRKGKVPEKVIAEKFEKGIKEEVLERVLKTEYGDVIQKEKIAPVTYPKVMSTSITEEKIEIKMEVEIIPAITLPKYKGLVVEKPKFTFKEEHVDAELKKMAEENSTLKEIAATEKAVLGDVATIDFEGFLGSVPFEGGKGEGYDLKLGSHSFIDNFEEQVVGHKKGDKFDVNVKFPADYFKADLADQKVTFKVEVKAVKRVEYPKFDDEFAKDLGFDDLAALKAAKKREIEERETAKIEHGYINTILEKIRAGVSIEIPEVLVKRETENRVKEFEAQLKQQGIPMDYYLKVNNLTKESLYEEVKPHAIEKIKMDLILDEIARFEGVKVSEEEIEEKIAEMAKYYNAEVEQLKAQLKKAGNYEVFIENLTLEKISQKTIDLIVSETLSN